MEVFEKIKKLLDENNIEYKTIHHEPVFTSIQAAKVRGTELRQGARALIFSADGKLIQTVTSAQFKVGSRIFKEKYKIKDLVLADKDEIKKATNCKIGAVSPFGNLFNIPVYVDKSLAENFEIAFNAGTNTDSIKMKYADYIKIVKPEIGEFSEKE